jgi:hypothetical protein
MSTLSGEAWIGSIVTTSFAYKIRKQIRLGMVGARFLTNSPMLSAEGLTECKLNQTIQCEHFCCDRRELTRSASFLIRGFRISGRRITRARILR